MEQHYTKGSLFTVMLLLILYLPHDVFAQCQCSDGTPALTIVNTISKYKFPSNVSTPLSLPRFNSSMGSLMCVSSKVTLLSVATFTLENEDTKPVNYIVTYERHDSLWAPGIDQPVTGTRVRDYGPFALDEADPDPNEGADFVRFGPDTVYNNVIYESSTMNVDGYVGDGNVQMDIKSKVNGSASGSDYWALRIRADNWVTIDLTYSYCPNEVLSSNIKNFIATLKEDNNVSLSWTVPDESKNNIYEIELSENRKNFRPVAKLRSKSADGTSAKYNYEYHADQLNSGHRYFRIKQTGGKSVAYSEIRLVDFSGGTIPGLTIYPNPVMRNLNLRFEEPVSGDFQVQLSNHTGQLVYSKSIKMEETSLLQLTIDKPPPPGIYYLRAKDNMSNKIFTRRLVITR